MVPKQTVVIFISQDDDEAMFEEHYSTMPWFALPWPGPDRYDAISARLGVDGLPALVVCDKEGNIVPTSGAEAYKKYF